MKALAPVLEELLRGRRDAAPARAEDGRPSAGQVGIAWYILHAERNVYLPAAIEVLALEGDRVREITAFADSAALYPRFGLPGELPG